MKTAVIIVTYNFEPWIKKCMSSVYFLENVEIIVVDNASTDNTCDLLERNYPNIHLHKNERNLGFGAANNLGLAIALRMEADYVLLLNQDAWLLNDCLEILIEKSIKYPEFGILSPLHLTEDKKNLDHKFCHYLSRFGNRELTNSLFTKEFKNEPFHVGFVNAAIWFMPINTIKKCGGFDPLFFHYGEDNDYISRLNFYNLKLGILMDAKAVHGRTQQTEDYNHFHNQFNYELRKNLILLKKGNKSLAVHYINFLETKTGDIINSIIKLDYKNLKNKLRILFKISGLLPSIYHSRKKSYKAIMPFLKI